jgi:hypothetical protein
MPLRDSEIQNAHLWTLKLTKMKDKVTLNKEQTICNPSNGGVVVMVFKFYDKVNRLAERVNQILKW